MLSSEGLSTAILSPETFGTDVATREVFAFLLGPTRPAQ